MIHPQQPRLVEFSHRHHLEGLSEPALEAIVRHRSGYTVEKGHAFLQFQCRIDRELLQHPVITDNAYTAWFSRGEQSREQVRAFIIQFSVFSNQFLVAQLQKTINADTLDGMRSSKEILANEIGVIFNGTRALAGDDVDREGDPELVSTEGTVEGGVFRFRAAHFEWLNRIAGRLGLEFSDIGRRQHATASTLFYCDELIRLYGSADYAVSQAASYAVENWAAAGFWDELVAGLELYNQRTGDGLPLSFFSWHSRLEAQHAQHTQEELEELYCTREIDEDRFIRIGNEMLDGVAAFWDGLEQQRSLTA
jgi:pyrroloquinoline quinone (PQQ) biosynthesis protein C